MDPRFLLIASPPHSDFDPSAAAPYFGLTAAEVRIKANYGVPEIWFVQEDRESLVDAAEALGEAGLNTVVVEATDLVNIPPQIPAESLDFQDEGLRVSRDGSERTVAYDAPLIGVFARPRAPVEAKSTEGSVASRFAGVRSVQRHDPTPAEGKPELGSAAFLDIYTQSDAGLLRISIVQGISRFARSPTDRTALGGMSNLVQACEDRFTNAHFDRRLVNMTLRAGTQRVKPVDSPPRRGFSFATMALTEVLGSLSPDLKGVGHADLSSRLAYLTSRPRIS